MKKNRVKFILIIHLVLLSVLLLSACQGSRPTQEPPTPTSLIERPSSTASPSPTLSLTPTTTPTATTQPTPDETKTPTPTNTPLPPNLSLTPIPLGSSPITQDTLRDVKHLAVWGNGAAEEIALSEDGNLLAVGTALGTFIYDSFDFRFYTLLRSSHPVKAVAFAPDDNWIAVLEGTQQLAIYSLDSFEKTKGLDLSSQEIPEGSSQTLFFSPSSDKLILLNESSVQIDIDQWETESWEPSTSFSVNASLGSYVNPDVGILGVITEDNLILHSLTLPGDFRILPLPKADLEALPDSQPPQPIIPAAEGDFLLLNRGKTVAYWDLIKNEIDYHLEAYPQGSDDPCQAIPDSCRNTEGGFSFTCGDEPAGIQAPVRLLAITPDDQRMLISLTTNRTELRSTYSGALIWEIDAGYTKVLFSLEFRFLLGLLPDGTIEKRDLLDGALLRTFKQHPTVFYDLDIAPEGSLLAAGFSDGWIRIFNTQTGEMLGVLEGYAQSLKFSPDGQQLAAGLVDGTLRLFDLNRGRHFDLQAGNQAPVTGIAFSPDGVILSTTSLDCTINRWNLKDRYRTAAFVPLAENPIQLLDIEQSKGYDSLFAAWEKGMISVEGERVETIFTPEPGNSIADIAVSEDGRYLAAGGSSLWLFTNPSGWQSLPIQKSPFTNGDTFRVAFLPSTHLLVTANGQRLSFYANNDEFEPALLYQLLLPPTLGPPVDLALSASSSLIAIAAENGLIHIFGIP